MRPLHGSSFYGSLDTARLLIERGANVLSIDETESIPFALACRNSHFKIVEMFYEVFPQHEHSEEIVRAVDSEKNTLLHLAVAVACVPLVDLLISKQADPTAQREDGQTAIHLCAKNDSVEILKRLTQAGGNLNDMDKEGETILHKAAAHNKENVLEYILSEQVHSLLAYPPSTVLALFSDRYQLYPEEKHRRRHCSTSGSDLWSHDLRRPSAQIRCGYVQRSR